MFTRRLTAGFSTAVFTGLTTLAMSVPLNAEMAAQDGGDDPTVILYSGGIDAMFPSAKDQGLVRSLHLLDERLAELPAELDADDLPGPIIELATQLLMGPMTLRGRVLEGVDPNSEPPFWMQVNFYSDNRDAASQLAARLSGLLSMAGQGAGEPVDLHGTTLNMIDADGVDLLHGEMMLGDRPSAMVAMQRSHAEPPPLEDWQVAVGVTPALAGRIDLGTARPMIEKLLEEVDEDEVAAVRRQMDAYGLTGDHPLIINFAHGFSDGKALSWMRMANSARVTEQWGVDRERPLTEKELRIVPSDATWAQVTRFDMETYVDAMIDMLREMPDAPQELRDPAVDPLDMVAEQIGIHPRHELLAHLGDVMGAYSSDTTGGGLLGIVTYVSVDDEAGMQQTMRKITAMANTVAAQETEGYVRLEARMIDEHEVTVLTFPGLPVPMEVAIGQANGYLFAPASPGALRAAMQHAASDHEGLAAHKRFRAMGGDDLRGAFKVTFMDTPRLVGGGYGLVSLGASALSNFVKSPHDQRRGSGFIMPSYHDLVKDVKASVSITRFDGDDILVQCAADESALANICGAVGTIGGGTGALMLGALWTGALLPAVAKARDTALETQSMANLRTISMAMNTHAGEHNGRYPDNREALRDYFDDFEPVMTSPFGPAVTGDDYWLDLRGKNGNLYEFPDQQIIGYDRAMLETQHRTVVLFADGHIVDLEGSVFRAMAADDVHAGVDFDLP